MTERERDPRAAGALVLDGLPVRVVDVAGVWPTLRVGRSVPLGRLEWLWNMRGTAVRDSSTSAKAIFNVTSSATLDEPSAQSQAHAWFRRSYLHILVITIPELASQSKGTEVAGWARVRPFVESCREQHLEYLVICVADDQAVSTNRRLLERLRAEVNLTTRGRERVVTVPPAIIPEEMRPISHLHHSPTHRTLLIRLRECARDGVEARVQAYEAETQRSYTSRASTSWSFNYHFALKEGMSFVFMQIGRRDLALKCYDELSAMMVEREDHGIAGFGAVPGADAAEGVLDPYARDYRDLIIAGNIAELDFRTYLFARQSSLLLAERKYSEIAERGLNFVASIARRIAEESAEEGNTIAPTFRDAWVFSVARALASALTPAIPSSAETASALSKQLGTARERHTARLIASFHVHGLKAFAGLAQHFLPGTLVTVSETPRNASVLSGEQLANAMKDLGNPVLQRALADPRTAVDLYSEMANAAASLYEMGGRARGAAALDGDAGVVRLRNNNLSEAEELLSAQCSRFTEDHGWDQLHRRRRVELAIAEKQMHRVQEYLVSCLTMLLMTRVSRRVGATSAGSDDDAFRKEAAHWAAEATEAAARLPRVMKYKAEKLVVVSVQHSEVEWVEGDTGTATVLIESDIPTELLIDSVVVDLRVASGGDGRAPKAAAQSALRAPDGAVSDGAQPAPPAESLLLSASGSVKVAQGLTQVQVTSREEAVAGRYTVHTVALIVGRLKLVQAAVKAPTVPTVITKGMTSTKLSSAAMAASAAHADLPGSVKARFTCFFVKGRQSAAKLSILDSQLFIAPNSVQYVTVRIEPGALGVSAGAELALMIGRSATPGGTNGPVANCEAHLVDKSEIAVIPEIQQRKAQHAANEWLGSVLQVDVRDNVEGVVALEDAIPAGSSLEARLALRIVASDQSPFALGGDHASAERRFTIDMTLKCVEMESERKQSRSVTCSHEIVFASPLLLVAQIDLSSQGDELPMVHAGDTEGPYESQPLDGGTLLCTLRSRAGPGRNITVKSTALSLPPWLELREDGHMSRASLMPAKLGNNSVMTLAFDFSVLALTDGDAKDGLDKLKVHASTRTLSRLTNALDVDRGDLEASGGSDNETGVQNEADSISVRVRRGTSEPEIVSDGENGNAVPGLRGNQIPAEDFQDIPAASLERIDVDSRRDDSVTSRQADVVTKNDVRSGSSGLGAGNGSSTADQGAGSSLQQELSVHGRLYPGGMDAVLRLEVEVDGIAPVAILEQRVNMSECRQHQRRYRIERSHDASVTVGTAMILRFQVSAISGWSLSEGDLSESEVLHYEVEADPSEWIVAGRRKGQIIVSASEGDIGRVSIIPLKAGRLYVPSLRLFERDGRPQNGSRFDNMNKGRQVTVLPSSSLITTCSSTPLPLQDLQSLRMQTVRESTVISRAFERTGKHCATGSVAVVAGEGFL